MKLTDLLANPGRPIAYYPQLRLITGSVNATLLLCQLLYWHGKQHDPNGWIVKRGRVDPDDPWGNIDALNQSIEQETGLTYKEQKVARRLLRTRGLLRERRDRLRHLMYFQLDLQAIRAAWDRLPVEQLPKRQVAVAQTASAS
jgi:hypothetical protein